jgi:hypothetical protein
MLQVRGVALKLARNATLLKPYAARAGSTYAGNIVHSNSVGFTFYKNGYRPEGGALIR